ncbi:4'-phosphopantetheinyl transferase superfamily protein [Pseudoroseomonas wenyumeiae]|uniref:4'-phosphopantetheinyl transferase superfamily protein n=1 Tax=Teichococcus wenyumeiae TaxID=2478470 RepID=A0A3A9JC66_9PROT|nr:4'-phosphopantetheinyl transferase superfamily protein [Pseudoroseomonas wenyumeiae]RKK02293.1 4'-phosphopantetheinyl transferase superfamily protein [Pseudoroseomonas wenyumeiae]RMI17554.1 4'-phosphopantetheinyl transferase superfamily protein [Pseudoroseomonas wenyumeiae]
MKSILEDVGSCSGGLPQRGLVRLQWRVPSKSDAMMPTAWWSFLDAEERDRAVRFHNEEDRQSYVAAHALKRAMLAEATGLEPGALRWMRNHAGKPELHPALNFPQLRFNISHTRGLVACGLTLNDDIGVDVEAITRPVNVLELAEHSFTREEFTKIGLLPAHEHEAYFLRLWTLKEAFVKALGTGLPFGLDRFSMRLDPISLVRAPEEAGSPDRWRFTQLHPTPCHVLSVATRHVSCLAAEPNGMLTFAEACTSVAATSA